MIYIPRQLSRHYILQHPNYIFIFDDNILKQGHYEHSTYCRGNENCYGIPTRRTQHCLPECYFDDEDFEEDPNQLCRRSGIRTQIDRAFESIPKDGRPCIILPNIGCGSSQLHTKAPGIYKYITQRLSVIGTSYELI